MTRNAQFQSDLSLLVRCGYMADSSACLDHYIRPARKVFNSGKRKKSQGARSVE